MKKIVLTLAAIGLFFTTTQAQVEGEGKTEVEVENELVVEVNEFEQIEIAELPEAVKAAIIAEHPEAPITEAFMKNVDEEVTYKVNLNVEGLGKDVYLDAEGNWIKQEDKKEESN